MNKILKNIGLTILSLSLIVLSTYGAGTIITNLTQTATTGDIISSEWVNAVNTNLNSAAAATGGGVSCVGTSTVFSCIWSDGTHKQYNGSIWTTRPSAF